MVMIQATLDDPDQTQSQTILDVIIFNSCPDSVVNSDNSLVISDFIAPDSVSVYESPLYPAPSNSAELVSEDGIDCGQLSYTLLTKDR